MKWFLLVCTIVICALFVLMGWVYVRNSESDTKLILDKREVEKDTDAAVETFKDIAEDAEEGFKKIVPDSQPRDSSTGPADPEAVPP
jgi:hypothetical protein